MYKNYWSSKSNGRSIKKCKLTDVDDNDCNSYFEACTRLKYLLISTGRPECIRIPAEKIEKPIPLDDSYTQTFPKFYVLKA